jgi:membrane protease YdiL (CAAX protease family)
MNTEKTLTPRQAWVDIVLMLALVLLSALVVGTVLGQLLQDHQLAAVLIVQGTLILVALRALLLYRRQGWKDIGLHRPRLADFPHAVVALLLCFIANLTLTSLLFLFSGEPLAQHLQTLRRIAAELQTGVPLGMLMAMMLFVGLYEELVARGFLLARSRGALGGVWAPVLVSSLLFGLGHVYQGWIGVAQTTLIGVILATLTLRWGTLWPAILAHAGLNTVSLTLIRALPETGL